jgi:dipeptidyl aminopeptidase/acylaminoacyl peptidase
MRKSQFSEIGPAIGASQPARRKLSRGALFAVLLVACVTLAIGYVAWARLRTSATTQVAANAPVTATTGAALPAGSLPPSVIFRSTQLDTFGATALVPLAKPTTARNLTTLNCDRVYFAAGQGVCLASDRGVFTSYSAVFFGPDFQPKRTLPLSGIPSRTRIAPDGRYASITVFVSGHSYSPGSFSTLTTLYDLASGASLGDLEQFEVQRDGVVFSAADFNFWGVTFARDSNRFYATLATGGTAYLIAGDIAKKQARIIYEKVECPSLSPDNQRVAFKRLNPDYGWQLYLLDLSTMVETPLAAETRSIDDQVEWLDNKQILYTLSDDNASATPGENIWVLPIDGNAGPRIFQTRASSPAVVH